MGGTDSAKKFVYRYRWAMFVLLVVAYFFVYFHRMSLNAMGGAIINDVGSGSKEILSSIYFWTYAAMQIPSGIMADRLGPRKTTFVFLTIASVGSFLTFAAQDFMMVAVGKVFIAAGMAVIYIPLMKIVAVWFKKENFPELNGIVIAVGNVGALAAAGPLRMLSEAMGWRNVFLILGLITVLIAILCLLIIRDHPKDMGRPGIEEIEFAEKGTPITDRSDAKASVLKGLKVVAGSGRIFWTMSIAYFLVYGSIMVFQGTTSIDYFGKHIYTFPMAAWFITMLAVGKIISTLLIGTLSSRGIIKSKKNVMAFGTFLFAVTWGIIWLFAGQFNDQWFWIVVCTLFGFFGGFMTLSFTQVKEWFPISIAGTSVSAMNVMLFLGASVCTTIASFVLHKQYIITNYQDLWLIMFIAAFVAFVMVALSKEKKEGDEIIQVK
ncbi:MAG: MFS transporter [Candidatus Methanomethylophilaceae archaeon]|nr:MFS transporter [Candidatus Methanomethylophilaceae archaeon]